MTSAAYTMYLHGEAIEAAFIEAWLSDTPFSYHDALAASVIPAASCAPPEREWRLVDRTIAAALLALVLSGLGPMLDAWSVL